eukprot:5071373-Pyramimonas_sp.AAC.1
MPRLWASVRRPSSTARLEQVDADLLHCWPSEGGEQPRLHVLAVLGRPLRAAVAPVCPVDLCPQVAAAVA